MTTLLLALAMGAPATPLNLTFTASGIFERLGAYAPFNLPLSDKRPDTLKAVPEGVSLTRFGSIKAGTQSFLVAFDSSNAPWVDTNGDGVLDNDPKVEWQEFKAARGGVFHQGSVWVDFRHDGKSTRSRIGLYDVNEGKSFGYYIDFALTGAVDFGGVKHQVVYSDANCVWNGKTGVLFIDKDDDKKFHPGYEIYPVEKPFNIGGKTFEVKGTSLVRSTSTVAERTKETIANDPVANPNLANGLKSGVASLPFSAKTLDGQAIDFPKNYAGKVVLLDFWATWCGPCMREVPNLVEKYKAYHDKGFEILGVSLDDAGSDAKIAEVTQKMGMAWPQICDGKTFKGGLGGQYKIQAIPQAYLVDGSTGKILAGGEDIRGEKLGPAIEKALAELNSKANR